MSSSSTASATAPAPVAAAAASLRHPLTLSLLALTFTTGLIDAASYLGLGHVFTANMTGNVVLLGFGIAGAAGLPVLSPLVSLTAFLLGAVAGGRLAARIADRHHVHLRAALLIEFTLTAIAAVIAAVSDVHPNELSGDSIVALLAFGMGIRNAAVRRIAVPDLTTTVLTLTLTGLAADSRLAGGTGQGDRPPRVRRRGDARRRRRRRAHAEDEHRSAAELRGGDRADCRYVIRSGGTA